MPVLYSNNATSALSASITNTATSFSVTAGHGARFPAISGGDYFYATLIDGAGNLEIVRVTARSTDTFTVTRGQDGTTARAYSVDDRVELRITRSMLDDFKTDTRTGYLPLSGGALTGSLGVGAALSSWGSGSGTVVELASGALFSNSATNLLLTNNMYFDGTNWRLKSTGFATMLQLISGQLTLWNSGSGFAGDVASITTRMTVGNGGELNVTGAITQNNSQVLHAGNFTSYSPSLTGSGASGTWGISISGNAATVTSITSGQVTTALGYTPVNKAGDSITGPLGVNTTFLNNYLLRVGGNMSGATTRGAVEVNATAQSDVTSEARGIVGTVSTAAASFTVGQASAFFAAQGTIGAGSAITTQVGFLVGSGFTGGATNNYGFRGAIPSGTGRWNLYMDGTADNYLAGNTGIGGAASAVARLRIVGSGASSEVARLEGGTLSALLLINQTDDPGTNTNRSGISLRKNNIEGGAISVEYNGTRGIVYYDASGATGQHAFYVNGNDRMRLSPFGGLSFDGAGYGTAGQFLKSGGANAAAAWGSLTSGEVTTALGFTPISGNQSITVSGDASGSGATAISLTLANSGVTAGTYTKVTVDAKGRVTTGASLVSADLPTYTGTITSTQVTTALGFTPGVGDVTLAGTQTLTNKRVTQRVGTVASAATITPTADTADVYTITALATAATVAAPSGTPTDGQRLLLRFEDNGTGRALTWTTTSGAYRSVGGTLPTTTVAGKVTYVGCVYNSQDVFWDVVAVAVQP